MIFCCTLWGGKTTICKASNQYNIPKTTLSPKLNNGKQVKLGYPQN